MSTQLLDRLPADRLKYAARVTDTGKNETSLWQTGLRQQVFRGDEEFVAFMQALASTEQRSAGHVPKAQRKLLSTLRECQRANSGSTRGAAHGVTRVRHHDDRDRQRVATVGVAHQPIDCCCGHGRLYEGARGKT